MQPIDLPTSNFDNSDATTAALAVTAGTLAGTGTLTASGAGTWSGGVMKGSGTTRITATGTLALAGTVDVAIDTRTLDNFGSMVFGGTGGRKSTRPNSSHVRSS